MNEFISIRLTLISIVISRCTIDSTVFAPVFFLFFIRAATRHRFPFIVYKRMIDVRSFDVALFIIEPASISNCVAINVVTIIRLDSIAFSICLGAIVNCSSSNVSGEPSLTNRINHVLEDVFPSLLSIGDDILKAIIQSYGDFSFENSIFCGWVKPFVIGVVPDFFWKGIQNHVASLSWSEYLIITDIGDCFENIKIFDVVICRLDCGFVFVFRF